MQNSAYLVIEHTEAMHVIDVNSGGRNRGDSDSQEKMLLRPTVWQPRKLPDNSGCVIWAELL